eukprot:CAMPEP_0205929494 /NCGR_PEP_ID=MMETSP1325-20131115/25340_1 /ASSEMBLY_ACC=CAM_ASM_000708 /TAXON_ID=236786 /ORGANISM="Florenciella sp., Strain RCC1007" /LENGTH=52 /DNA_ID=CAMNT_0053298713 /DNA_START=61 /DNA_END=215 /DNA_ORIENTATION=-
MATFSFSAFLSSSSTSDSDRVTNGLGFGDSAIVRARVWPIASTRSRISPRSP